MPATPSAPQDLDSPSARHGYEHLLAPLRIGPLTLRNRVLLAPMGTEMGTEDGRSTPREAAYYGARADGGTALVMTGVNFVQSEVEPIAPGLARVDTDAHTPGLAQVAEAIHAGGALAALQLTMGLGRNNQNCRSMGMEPVSASDNPWFFDAAVACRPLTREEIAMIVRRTGEAARRADEAGFDVIDIHGHTGYLVDQFMSACWNRREDEYGGSPAGRARFAMECIAAVKENAPGRVVSFRLSVDHRFEGGRRWQETQTLIPFLEEAGVDLILCDDGSYEAMDYVFPPYYLGDDCMVSAARTVREVATVPVAACGNITPASGEAILARGDADLIAIGRGLIADPDLVTKLQEGRDRDIRPCIRCNQLCIGNAFVGQALGCAVNPEVGHEGVRVLKPAEARRRIVVIGAGPAGLEAARVAGIRGHHVDLYERRENLGGVLFPAATPEFKKELRRMIPWWEHQLAQLEDVHLHLGVEVTPDLPALHHADEIVVASGTDPLLPGVIPGLDGPDVVDVLAFHEGAEMGERVVVCGGGLSGADASLELAQDGHRVTIVEMKDEVAADMLPLNRIPLLRQLAEAGVRILTSTQVLEVSPGQVRVRTAEGEEILETDTVMAAFGLRPQRTLGEHLAAAGLPVRMVGDCERPRKVGDAINDAYVLAAAL